MNKATQGEGKNGMTSIAELDHEYRVAAYVVTWVIQLGYLAWLCLKWRAEKRKAARTQ